MQPADIYRRMVLDNGLEIVISDRTRVYFGDYHLVRLEITCRTGEGAGPGEGAPPEAVAGLVAEFSRVVERMGVPSAAVESARESLVNDFLATSLAYLNAPDFPAKLAHATLRQPKKITHQYGENKV